MIATNHLLAGSIIGIVVTEPVSALSLALLSHYAMDALPHFGYAGQRGYGEALKHRASYVVGGITLISSIAVAGVLAHYGLWFSILAGLVAVLPDVLGLYNWLVYEKRGLIATGMLKVIHVDFHRRIQLCERPWGIIVELLVLLILGAVLFQVL